MIHFNLVKLLFIKCKAWFCGIVLCANDGFAPWFLKWGNVIICFTEYL